MKARIYHFRHGGAVLLLSFLAACQHDELPSTPPAGDATVITFNSPYTVDTRSAAMRYGSFQQGDKVGVLGFCMAENNGTDYSTSDWNTKKPFCRPDVFYNQMLEYDGAGWWDYSWTSGTFDGSGPVGGKLHPWSKNPDDTFAFFAYYPYADVNNSNGEGTIRIDDVEMGEIKLSSSSTAGDPKITYTMPHTGHLLSSDNKWWEVPDLMLAYKIDHLKRDGSVSLNFRHLFCAFQFRINNYNSYPVTISDLYVSGGTTDGDGFYKSVSVTGQESDYTVGTDRYIGEFKLLGGATDEGVVCPPAQEDGTPTTVEVTSQNEENGHKDEVITLLFIPDAQGKLTSDGNRSLNLTLRARSEHGEIDARDISMNLAESAFQPGVRSIFNINIVGNNFTLLIRTEGSWEDDGDSDIVFE